MILPTFNDFINEGALTNYRAERENMKISINQMKGSFDEVVCMLIKERIPFYFDCLYKEHTKIGYLMHNVINGVNFNGFILDDNMTLENLCKTFKEKILPDVVVEKPGKLHIGRSNFADLTKANDIDTICVVVKAFKGYSKDKNLSSREITGNKYEVNINIDFICDNNNANNLIDFVF